MELGEEWDRGGEKGAYQYIHILLVICTNGGLVSFFFSS